MSGVDTGAALIHACMHAMLAHQQQLSKEAWACRHRGMSVCWGGGGTRASVREEACLVVWFSACGECSWVMHLLKTCVEAGCESKVV